MKFFICGYFGAGNLGDDAILIAEASSLKERIKNATFDVLSFKPKKTKELLSDIEGIDKIRKIGHGVKFLFSDFLGIYKSIKKSDLIIIGGGGLFQNLYNNRMVLFFSTLCFISKLLNKTVILYAIGVGPLNGLFIKSLVRTAVNKADLIMVRDRWSKNVLENLGMRKKINVTADPVFLLRVAKNNSLNKNESTNNGKLCIAVAVNNLLGFNELNKESFAQALDYLIEEKNAQITFMPFGRYNYGFWTNGLSNSDITISQEIIKRMRNKANLITDSFGPLEAMKTIEKFDLIIGMRLHSLIMTAIMQKLFFGITYSREKKIMNFLRNIGFPDNYQTVESLNKSGLIQKIGEILENKNTMFNRAKRRINVLQRKTERNNDCILKLISNHFH